MRQPPASVRGAAQRVKSGVDVTGIGKPGRSALACPLGWSADRHDVFKVC
jgi:hypothetical protein